MRLSGVQYYWLIAAGLILQLVLAYPLSVFSVQVQSNTTQKIALLVVTLPVAICYLTVLLEIWAVFRFKALIYAITLSLLAFIIYPVFLVVLILSPHIYWAWRFNGVKVGAKKT